jgi:hypothetical protein
MVRSDLMKTKISGLCQGISHMPFHELIPDAYYENEQSIHGHKLEVDGIEPTMVLEDVPRWRNKVFDYFTFLKGERFKSKIPEFVRLYIKEGDENLPMASLLVNMLSWLIFSEELLEFVKPLIEKDVQIFDAPVYFKSGEKVAGYKIINPIRVIDCIDWENSRVGRDEDGTVSCMGKICIKESLVGEHHLFRLKGWTYSVIVSDQLAKSIAKKGFKGIAFVRCGVS